MPRTIGAQILGHLRAAAPSEGVGLIAVTLLGGDGVAEATHFYPGTNLDASPSRYTMDPAEVLAAFRDMEARGWRLGAIAHSHPVTAAVPSETDLREAHYRDALMLIVSLAGTTPEIRAWQVVPAETATWAVVEVPVMGMGAEAKAAATDWRRRSGPVLEEDGAGPGQGTRGGG
ncbi:MAG: M67 family metallopeptidase [Chloroflexota bacterium]|nr:M67 family metallopeptidase [Chloroflexota bacterium]